MELHAPAEETNYGASVREDRLSKKAGMDPDVPTPCKSGVTHERQLMFILCPTYNYVCNSVLAELADHPVFHFGLSDITIILDTLAFIDYE
jgi:hypothetical protein